MIKLVLLVLAIVLFALVAAAVISTNVVRWEAGAAAAFAASFLPWPA